MNIIFKPECKTEIIEPTYDLPIIGEPISKTGASANNSNAYGVIVGIIGDGSSRRVRVMTEGYIDYDKVKENYMEYTDEAINALTGITLCSGGKLPTGGDDEPDFYVNVVGTSSDAQGLAYLTLDATNEQIFTAYESGKHVFINILGLANAQVQKDISGSLYAIAFIPQTIEISGITKLGVYYLEAMNPQWRMQKTYISTTTE